MFLFVFLYLVSSQSYLWHLCVHLPGPNRTTFSAPARRKWHITPTCLGFVEVSHMVQVCSSARRPHRFWIQVYIWLLLCSAPLTTYFTTTFSGCSRSRQLDLRNKEARDWTAVGRIAYSTKCLLGGSLTHAGHVNNFFRGWPLATKFFLWPGKRKSLVVTDLNLHSLSVLQRLQQV